MKVTIDGFPGRVFWYCRDYGRWMLSPCSHRKCRRQGWTPDIPATDQTASGDTL